MPLFDRDRDGVDFLDEAGTDLGGQRSGARAGDEGAEVRPVEAGEIGLDGRQHLFDLFRLPRFVPLVPAPEYVLGIRIDDDALDRRRPNIDAQKEPFGKNSRTHTPVHDGLLHPQCD